MSDSPSSDTYLTISPPFAPSLRARRLDSLDALMQVAGDADLDKPGLEPWRQRITLRIEGQKLFLKRYHRPPLRVQLAARLRGYRATAAVEWHWLEHLRRLGIPAPAPVAWGYARRAGFEHFSVLVTAAVPGRSLEQWVRIHQSQQNVPWLSDRNARHRLSAKLAQLVARLHDAGLFHRDLYLSHIFVDPHRHGKFALTLIDLQRVVRSRLRRSRWRVKDLAALNYSVPSEMASTTDRLRWFKLYLGHLHLSPTDKALVRRIVTKTARIARHDHRRSANLADH